MEIAVSTHKPSSTSRSERFRTLLAQDPGNTGLILATATAFYDEGSYSAAAELLATQTEVSRDVDQLRGLVAMSLSRFEEAAAIFAGLLAGQDESTTRYNLAYALAMLDQPEEALTRLDDSVCSEIDAAVALRMRVLYRLGRFDEMMAIGERHLVGTEDPHVRGLLSMALFDQGDFAGAAIQAAKGLESAEGATTAGMLALEDGDDAQAQSLFEGALSRNPHSGRALLGRGLVLTLRCQFSEAATALESAARLLRGHSGAWVTAGWARLMEGELDIAETDFRAAMDLDRGFSEAAGGLGMVYLQKDMHAEARRHSDIALRLDPGSLTGAYIRGLLQAGNGNQDAASATFVGLLHQPIGGNGPTLGTMLARRGVTRGR